MLGRGLPIAPRPEPRNEADLGVGRGEEAGLQDVSYTEGFPAKLWGGGQVLLSYPAPPPEAAAPGVSPAGQALPEGVDRGIPQQQRPHPLPTGG